MWLKISTTRGKLRVLVPLFSLDRAAHFGLPGFLNSPQDLRFRMVAKDVGSVRRARTCRKGHALRAIYIDGTSTGSKPVFFFLGGGGCIYIYMYYIIYIYGIGCLTENTPPNWLANIKPHLHDVPQRVFQLNNLPRVRICFVWVFPPKVEESPLKGDTTQSKSPGVYSFAVNINMHMLVWVLRFTILLSLGEGGRVMCPNYRLSWSQIWVRFF